MILWKMQHHDVLETCVQDDEYLSKEESWIITSRLSFLRLFKQSLVRSLDDS